MNKAELVQAIAEKAGIDKAAAGRRARRDHRGHRRRRRRGDKVQVPGWAPFEGRDRAGARVATRRPARPCRSPPPRVSGFKAAAGFKSARVRQVTA